MTDAEILGLFEKTEFPEFLGEDNAEDFIENMTHFPETFKFTWNMGASKLVILPCGEDFVIKIPFNARYFSHGIDCETGEITSESGWEYFTSDDYYVEGMDFDGDYCGREADISDMATAEDLDECFAITKCVGKCGDYLIYKQELQLFLLMLLMKKQIAYLLKKENQLEISVMIWAYMVLISIG